MNDWTGTTLGAVGAVQSGFAFKSRDWTEFGVPVVKIQNVRNGRVNLEGCSFVPPEVASSAQRYRLSPGDVLITMSGEIGSIGIVRSEEHILLNQRVGRVQLAQEDPVLLRFIGYALQRPELKLSMESAAHGVAQPNISPSTLAALPVDIPPRKLQQAINGILSTLDDLIENNRRRVQLLEEMARAIYREWFVHFRYPGHEDVIHVDSPLGPVPKGWTVAPVGELFDVVLGGTPSRKRPEYWSAGTVPWITSTRVNDLRVLRPSELITCEALRSCGSTVMPKRTTLIAITGATLGQVSALEIETCANQSVVGVFDADAKYSEYVYLWFQANIGSVIRHASGSAQQHINKGTVSSTLILLPSPDVARQLQELGSPMFDLIADLLRAGEQLSGLRDLLLPRLVTGQLDVSSLDLDALVEGSVA